MLDRVKDVLARLPEKELRELAAHIDDLLVTDDEAEAVVTHGEALAATVTTREGRAVTYRLEKVKCGKDCAGCPHGPYLYKYWREDGRLRKAYVGKGAKP